MGIALGAAPTTRNVSLMTTHFALDDKGLKVGVGEFYFDCR
jgi:hypothetical protein